MPWSISVRRPCACATRVCRCVPAARNCPRLQGLQSSRPHREYKKRTRKRRIKPAGNSENWNNQAEGCRTKNIKYPIGGRQQITKRGMRRTSPRAAAMPWSISVRRACAGAQGFAATSSPRAANPRPPWGDEHRKQPRNKNESSGSL
jgi:hypothetical protein